MKKFGAASLFLLLTACLTGNAFAGIVFDISESGPNLVVTATGSLDLSGFTTLQTNGAWNPGVTYIRTTTLVTGSGAFDSYATGTTFFTSGGASGTSVFPSGPSYLAASTQGGDYVVFSMDNQVPAVNPVVYVPTGYTSNAPINGTATYSGLSLASLGMTPSTVWKWYLGADGDESQSITIVPEPSTYVIAFAGVAGASVLCGRRKKST
jgi:hypothetical protein